MEIEVAVVVHHPFVLEALTTSFRRYLGARGLGLEK
jgi:hypothetical protein